MEASLYSEGLLTSLAPNGLPNLKGCSLLFSFRVQLQAALWFVHMDSLLSMQFSYELLILSYKHRLYLHLQHYLLRATRFRELSPTPLERDSR